MLKRHARSVSAVITVALLAAALAGCRKKTATAPPPPPPPPQQQEAPAPREPQILQFAVDPNSIERGQIGVLRWNVEGSRKVSIAPGIGEVEPQGSQTVSPAESTTYTLTASNEAGTRTATAMLGVLAPYAPPAAAEADAKPGFSQRAMALLQDAYFDYDQSTLRDDTRETLTKNAAAIRLLFEEFPEGGIMIQGHCDERGSAEYNLGLGDRRAKAALEFLVQLAGESSRIRTVSYGKERPQCTEENQACFRLNRRVHFEPAP